MLKAMLLIEDDTAVEMTGVSPTYGISNLSKNSRMFGFDDKNEARLLICRAALLGNKRSCNIKVVKVVIGKDGDGMWLVQFKTCRLGTSQEQKLT